MQSASANTLPPPSVFISVLGDYAKHFPYDAFTAPKDLTSEHHFLVPNQGSAIRFLPLKADWMAQELLIFEGEEFAHAVTRSLRRRAPTEAEIYWLSVNNRPWTRLEFLVQMDRENRQEHTGIKLHGVCDCRMILNTSRWLEKRKMRFLAKVAHRIFRKMAKRKMIVTAADTSLRQMLLMTLNQVDKISRDNRVP